MKNFYFIIFLTLISSNTFGQVKLIGPSELCEGETLLIKVEGIEKTVNHQIEYKWKFANQNLGIYNSFLEKKNIQVNNSGLYSCNIKKVNSIDSIIILDTILYMNVIVNSLPDKIVAPKLIIDSKEIILFATKTKANLIHQWRFPNGQILEGPIIKIENFKQKKIESYILTIKDTTSNCISSIQHNISRDNENDELSNVNGIIDEDTGELSGVLRIADRNFPMFESDILGVKKDDNYLIAKEGTIWQIIGEINNYYLIQYLPRKREKSKKIKFQEEYNHLIDNFEQLTYELDSLKTLQGISKESLDEKISKVNLTIIRNERKIKNLINSVSIDNYFQYFETLPVLENHLRAIESNNFTQSDISIDGNLLHKYFLVKRSDFESRTRKFKYGSRFYLPGLTAGTILIPVKLRFEEFQFSKDITLGPFFGFKWLISNYKPHYFSLGFSTGITSVRLSPRNSNPNIITDVQDVAAFTIAYGGILDFNNVQLGIFSGFDWINNNNISNSSEGLSWVYQGRGWLSIGLGYSIISRPSIGSKKPKIDK